ncbi:sorting nexin-16 isoform 1-T1 [Anomaloglossus baeobatrachus]|uniref:sorting nexin-16 isoform X1 n=1 Tax=Anomaloglossus baeobatrachus TaxID=238106 RepID=UPI003F50C11A
MATPYVPVPIGNPSSGNITSRSQRSSSLGSTSTSSTSSKEPPEDGNPGSRKKLSAPDQLSCTSSVCSSPLVRTKFDSSVEYSSRPLPQEHVPNSSELEDRPSTPTILGYEVMEERAKFTVYKILVRRSPEESWVVFRRYTDFSRLNDRLKEMFPGFRLALPPKRWFKDNYDYDFLDDRQLGLQAFLQNLVAHKDIANCAPVRLFLCLDDPPGPFDSLEESRAFCETLEETNYRLQRDLAEKQKELDALKKLLNEKQLHIQTLESRVQSINSPNAGVQARGSGDRPDGGRFEHVRLRFDSEMSAEHGKTRRPSGEESECSGEVESSAIEADQAASADNGSFRESHENCWNESLPEIEIAEVADPDEEV